MYRNIHNKSNQKYPDLKIQTFFSDSNNYNNNSQYNKEKELRNNLENITNQYCVNFKRIFGKK